MTLNFSTNIKIRNVISISIIIFLELIFFRNVMWNGWMFGDDGDGRLTMLITEHWLKFFTGKEAFSDLLMFYPIKGTLGYSDMLLGFGLIHSLFRFVGIDMYLSYKFTLVILHVFGSLGLFFLLHKKLNVNLFWSFFALISFNYSTVFAEIAFGHPQLSAINLLPAFVYFFVLIIENWNSRKRRNLNSAFLIATYALICYTAWYIAFFTALFCLIFAIFYICQLAIKKESPLVCIKSFFCTFKFDLVFLLSFAVVLMIPFVMVYLPILTEFSGYNYGNVKDYMPGIIDLINVTSQNMMFGKVVSAMQLNGGEVAEGFSIIVLATFLILYYQSKKQKKCNIIIDSLFISVIFSSILCIKLSSSGLSLWHFVYRLIPGASSIRAVGRFLFFLSFPMSLYIALCGNSLIFFTKNPPKKFIIIFSCFLCLFYVSQMRNRGVSAGWDKQNNKNELSAISDIPEEAESFYLIPKIDDSRREPYIQLDAFELATTINIPTLNGYSGQEPKAWHGVWELKNPSYNYSINKWIDKNKLTNVFAYDANTNTWYPHMEKVIFFPLNISEPILFYGNNYTCSKYVFDGLARKEDRFTWTDGNQLVLKAKLENYATGTPVHAFLDCNVFNGTQRVNAVINNSERIELVAHDGSPLEFDFMPPEDGLLTIELELPDAISPKALGRSGDSRNLALAMKSIVFTQD